MSVIDIKLVSLIFSLKKDV